MAITWEVRKWGLPGLLFTLVLTVIHCGGMGGGITPPVITTGADVEILVEGEIYDVETSGVRFFRKTLQTELAVGGAHDLTSDPGGILLDVNVVASFAETGEFLQFFIYNINESSLPASAIPSFTFTDFFAHPRPLDECVDFSAIYYDYFLEERDTEKFATQIDSGLDPSQYPVFRCWDLDPATPDPAPVFDQGELTILGLDDTDGDTIVDTMELDFWFSAYSFSSTNPTRIGIRSTRFIVPFCRDASRQSEICDRMPDLP